MAILNDVEIDNMERWRGIKAQDIKTYSKDKYGFVAELL